LQIEGNATKCLLKRLLTCTSIHTFVCTSARCQRSLQLAIGIFALNLASFPVLIMPQKGAAANAANKTAGSPADVASATGGASASSNKAARTSSKCI
jgi:hypothetical protein